MSVAIRPKRLNPTQSLSAVTSKADPAPSAPRHVEAPEQGEHEAPETRISRHYEAPDRGEGRVSLLENEFTHGRSRS